jgi:hypothetical protein
MSDPRPWTKRPYPGVTSLTNEEAPIAAGILRRRLEEGQSPSQYQPPTPEQLRKQAVRKSAWHYCRAAAYALLAVVFAIAAASLLRGDRESAVVGFALTGVLVLLSLRNLRKARHLRRTSRRRS